ncbi:hypothetical protein A4A49_14467 [Nicotiana attenuata]|uniref:Uncharacterized protein n=1 Tax=Nicotiana attenuata TaxID=49451 RepID=A0A1J6IUU7_NICAT|nr:hypothetical protein A4A49_14467 [Nicotiana attenuata]
MQTTTVPDFRARFEAIANESVRLPEGCRAFAQTQPFLPNPTGPTSIAVSKPTASSSHLPKIPFKRLSTTELQSRREKGLCYNCDEKYTPNHKCKALPQLLLLENSSDFELPESFSPEDFIAEELQCLEVQDHSAISYHALAGGSSATTLRFDGHVRGSPVKVLVDGGSTHNFFQTRVAKFLNLPVEAIKPFAVMVGSGQRLRCEGVARQTPIVIHNGELLLDLYVLSMQGADIALGVTWLGSVGPILTDYSARTMEFFYQGQKFSWLGEPPVEAQPVQLQTLRRLSEVEAVSSYFCLMMITTDDSGLPSLPPDLQSLLEEFEDVFTKP